MTFLFYFFLFIFLILAVFLSFIILIQDSKNMGLGASFGGEGGDSLFGTSTADIVKKITAYLVTIFLASCVLISFWTTAMSHGHRQMQPVEVIEDVEN